MKTETIMKEIFSWIKYAIAGIIFSLVLNKTLIVNADVVSGSMENTLMTDCKVFGIRPAYAITEPERFDVILFKFPDDETSWPFVKRIVGLPNEKLEIKDGKVFIDDNNVPLKDDFIKDTSDIGDFGPYIIPEDSYFVMGDNRNSSHDSPDWQNKFVAKEKIIAKVILVWYPEIKTVN